MLFSKNKAQQKKLNAAMLAINSILREIYSNKSSDEYKMKGDITKSPSYKDIEKMVADLKSLKGYSQEDAKDMATLFNTLHRPVFKTLVKQYITDPNDRNTLFTSMFTIGYRLLVGELARIFASTEATEKGLVYKPNKVQKKADASKMIKLFNDDLENKLNAYLKAASEHPEDTGVNESYVMMLIDQIQQESCAEKKSGEVESVEESDDIVKDSTDGNSDDTDTDNDADTEPVSESTEEYHQEGVGSILSKSAGALASGATLMTQYSKDIMIIGTSFAIIAGLFHGVNAIFRGMNPVADVNYLFTDSYEKKIRKLDAVSRMYEETKAAYDEYMKIPEAQRKKKVESKYMKNMKKYNISMNNLAAQVEHFNSRAQKEAQEAVNNVENKLPTQSTQTESQPQGGDSGNTAGTDDDFQF